MISSAETVDQYLKALPADERAVFKQFRSVFKKASSQVSESMLYRMPTYLFGTEPFAAFNRQKQYMCVYLPPPAVDPYRKELKALGLDCGKSCLRFRKPGDLPLALVKKIVKDAVKLAEKEI